MDQVSLGQGRNMSQHQGDDMEYAADDNEMAEEVEDDAYFRGQVFVDSESDDDDEYESLVCFKLNSLCYHFMFHLLSGVCSSPLQFYLFICYLFIYFHTFIAHASWSVSHTNRMLS